MILTRQDRIDLAAARLVRPEAQAVFREYAESRPDLSVFWDDDVDCPGAILAGDRFSIKFTDYE